MLDNPRHARMCMHLPRPGALGQTLVRHCTEPGEQWTTVGLSYNTGTSIAIRVGAVRRAARGITEIKSMRQLRQPMILHVQGEIVYSTRSLKGGTADQNFAI